MKRARMDQALALELAKKRWGAAALAVLLGGGCYLGRIDSDVTFGSGTTWEEAFADADQADRARLAAAVKDLLSWRLEIAKGYPRMPEGLNAAFDRAAVALDRAGGATS